MREFKEGQKVKYTTSTDGVIDETGSGIVSNYGKGDRHLWCLSGSGVPPYSFDDEGIIHFTSPESSGQVTHLEE